LSVKISPVEYAAGPGKACPVRVLV
jgi:hypothetical protein